MNDSTRPRYRVLTTLSSPFVMYNATSDTYYGYSIDILNEIQSLIGFDYELKESTDKDSGFKNLTTGTWQGMIHELMINATDLILGPIWVMSDRASVVDFSIPFEKQNGFTIMMLSRTWTVSFLEIIAYIDAHVWTILGCALASATFLLFVFERYSPLSYKNNPEQFKNQRGKRFRSLTECFWFLFLPLMPQSVGSTPRNLSGKIVTASWWFFGFTFVAIYAANLASIASTRRFVGDIESLDDLGSQYEIEYSTIINTTAYRYFASMARTEERLNNIWMNISTDRDVPDWEKSEYTVWDYPLHDKFTNMFSTMEEVGFLPNIEEAVKMVRGINRTLRFALIDESLTIKYLMLANCGFKTIGNEFAIRPSAICAVQRGSPLRSKIDQALTTLITEGRLRDLEKKWWDENPTKVNCPPEKEFNAGLDCDHLMIVFELISIGILFAVLVFCLEYFWHCYLQKRRARRHRLFMRSILGTVSPKRIDDETSKIAALWKKCNYQN